MKSLVSFLLKNLPRTFLQRVSKPFFYLISFFYRGNNVNCPVCDSSFSKFFPYGRDVRENALCTNCLSLERHRFLYIFLKDIKKTTNQNAKVLHIAPEICLIKKFNRIKNFEYITADLDSPLADVKMDIHNMTFDDNSFDLIICNHVLEHVEDDILALKEIRRVLKKEGYGIIMIPFYYPIPEITLEDDSVSNPEEREKIFGQSDHLRKYGKDFKKRFELSGMKIEVIRPDSILNSKKISRYGIKNSDLIISVIK
ncbi:MAG: SAM-dependent methyltransferase [Flammeovirgaceae bacterium]|nr:SAM-dependent methyltransferase [Flammeovirgaceae bacterium]